MTIATYPYISGVSLRIAYLDLVLAYITGSDGVLFCHGDQVLNGYREQQG